MESKVEVENTAEAKLRQFFEAETEMLLRVLRMFVRKSHLIPDKQQMEAEALELLSETFLEAFKRPERFDVQQSPKAWVLGIAANLIKRKQAKVHKRSQREIEIDNLDEEFLDRITRATLGPELEVENRHMLKDILRELSATDQEILNLAMEHEFSGQAIATVMGIKDGAARTKLCRALQRAKDVWIQQNAYEFENSKRIS